MSLVTNTAASSTTYTTSAIAPRCCWGCQRGRVPCDAQRPACSRCTHRGLACPGYSATGTLKLKASEHKRPAPISLLVRPYLTIVSSAGATSCKDVASAGTVLGTMEYYNSVIAPDMSAIPSSVFAVSVDEWRSMDEASRHLYICLVAQHRTVCRSGDESQNRMLFHRHQAYAAQCLHRKLLKLGSKDPDPRLVEATSMFVCSQLQASVYGPWRIHLEGAKALLQRWGGYGSLLGRCDFACYILVTTDIYGTTTSPQALLGAETVSQHRLYERLLEQLQIDTWMTVVPVPIDILLATIHINILRADASADMDGNEDAVALRARESLSILSSLRSFDPRAWAMRLPAPTLRHLEGWMMLATCFQAATILYLFLGQPHGVLMDAESQGIRLASYHTLVAMVLELHRERRQDGKHYKFITWPMVMCGIEAVVQRDGVEIKFLCDALDVTTTDLGCMAMRDAADFLAALWRRTEKARAGSEEDVELNWNNVFERAPVFLM